MEANAIEGKEREPAGKVEEGKGEKTPEDDDAQMPELEDESDDEPKHVSSKQWVEELGGEDTSDDESDSDEHELMANEEGSQGFPRQEA